MLLLRYRVLLLLLVSALLASRGRCTPLAIYAAARGSCRAARPAASRRWRVPGPAGRRRQGGVWGRQVVSPQEQPSGSSMAGEE